MKLLYLLYVLSFTLLASPAKTAPITWHTGSLVLANNNVLTGEINVDEANDLVLVRNREVVDVYPAHKVSAAYFFDASAAINRKFVVFREPGPVLTIYHLYEVVVCGEISILRKEKQLPGSATNDALDFNYFIQMNDHFFALQEFRRKVFPELLDACGSSLKTFIRNEKLNINKPSSAIEIIRFYNSRNTILASK